MANENQDDEKLQKLREWLLLYEVDGESVETMDDAQMWELGTAICAHELRHLVRTARCDAAAIGRELPINSDLEGGLPAGRVTSLASHEELPITHCAECGKELPKDEVGEQDICEMCDAGIVADEEHHVSSEKYRKVQGLLTRPRPAAPGEDTRGLIERGVLAPPVISTPTFDKVMKEMGVPAAPGASATPKRDLQEQIFEVAAAYGEVVKEHSAFGGRLTSAYILCPDGSVWILDPARHKRPGDEGHEETSAYARGIREEQRMEEEINTGSPLEDKRLEDAQDILEEQRKAREGE